MKKSQSRSGLLTRLANISPRLKDKEEQGMEMKDKGSHHGAMD